MKIIKEKNLEKKKKILSIKVCDCFIVHICQVRFDLRICKREERFFCFFSKSKLDTFIHIFFFYC
jgi:hypothetical protein